MTDNVHRSKRSWVMAQVRSRQNRSTELRFIEILKSKGITGWRRNCNLAGKPDFVFPKSKIAVFVDGCFWHGCPKHCRMPSSNKKYWNRKIARNIERGKEINRKLRSGGWKVMRFWEHDLKSGGINNYKLRKLSKFVEMV